MRRFLLSLCVGAAISVGAGHVSAQQAPQPATQVVGRTMTYQGYLAKNGAPVADGDYAIQVTLYGDQDGKSVVWHGQYTSHVVGGIFNLLLGSGDSPFPGPEKLDGGLYLGFKVGDEAEMKPYTPVTASAYAMNVADGAITAKKMGTDYVGSLSINGQRLTGRGDDLNIVAGDGIEASVEPGSNNVVLRNNAAAAVRTKGTGVDANTTITGTLHVTLTSQLDGDLTLGIGNGGGTAPGKVIFNDANSSNSHMATLRAVPTLTHDPVYYLGDYASGGILATQSFVQSLIASANLTGGSFLHKAPAVPDVTSSSNAELWMEKNNYHGSNASSTLSQRIAWDNEDFIRLVNPNHFTLASPSSPENNPDGLVARMDAVGNLFTNGVFTKHIDNPIDQAISASNALGNSSDYNSFYGGRDPEYAVGPIASTNVSADADGDYPSGNYTTYDGGNNAINFSSPINITGVANETPDIEANGRVLVHRTLTLGDAFPGGYRGALVLHDKQSRDNVLADGDLSKTVALLTTDLLHADRTQYLGDVSGEITVKGNVFNGNDQLVNLTASAYYPALDGHLIYNIHATSASNADHAASASSAGNAGHATGASNANNAGHAGDASSAGNAGHATGASSANNAGHAGNASNAGHATGASSANNAGHAGDASSAGNAGHATGASSANNAGHANTASSAGNAGHATEASNANNAGHANTASSSGNASHAMEASFANNSYHANNSSVASTLANTADAGSSAIAAINAEWAAHWGPDPLFTVADGEVAAVEFDVQNPTSPADNVPLVASNGGLVIGLSRNLYLDGDIKSNGSVFLQNTLNVRDIQLIANSPYDPDDVNSQNASTGGYAIGIHDNMDFLNTYYVENAFLYNVTGNINGNATTASSAGNAGHANTASFANNSNHSAYASWADHAEHATEASSANNAGHANTASSSGNASHAMEASNANNAGHANTASSSGNASHAMEASNANNAGHANTASSSGNASHAMEASNANNAGHANTASSSGNASHAMEASNANNAGHANTASSSGNASHAMEASNANNAGHANTASSSGNASHAMEASNANNAGHANTASSAGNAGHANTASSAGNAGHAMEASNANNAGHANTASSSGNASHAMEASNANNAGHANTASSSGNASHAMEASSANNAGHANTASSAGNAGHATSASSADNAAHANYASWAGHSTHATDASSANNAAHAASASSAGNAGHALSASSANNAGHAGNASSAGNAGHATSASSADNAGHAGNASSAGNAGHATSASSANNAGHATSASSANNAAHAANASLAYATSAAYASTAGHAANASSVSHALSASNTIHANNASNSNHANNSSTASSIVQAGVTSVFFNGRALCTLGQANSAGGGFNATDAGTSNAGPQSYSFTITDSHIVTGANVIITTERSSNGNYSLSTQEYIATIQSVSSGSMIVRIMRRTQGNMSTAGTQHEGCIINYVVVNTQ